MKTDLEKIEREFLAACNNLELKSDETFAAMARIYGVIKEEIEKEKMPKGEDHIKF